MSAKFQNCPRIPRTTDNFKNCPRTIVRQFPKTQFFLQFPITVCKQSDANLFFLGRETKINPPIICPFIYSSFSTNGFHFFLLLILHFISSICDGCNKGVCSINRLFNIKTISDKIFNLFCVCLLSTQRLNSIDIDL